MKLEYWTKQNKSEIDKLKTKINNFIHVWDNRSNGRKGKNIHQWYPLNSDLELKKSKDSQRMEIQWKMEKEYW